MSVSAWMRARQGSMRSSALRFSKKHQAPDVLADGRSFVTRVRDGIARLLSPYL